MDRDVFERRFGGLRRLYGVQGAQRVFEAHVVLVGLGGVGSWTAEALARSGVRRLTLIDLDHVGESNLNRQLQATEPTLGQAKVQAMRERILSYHPSCEVVAVEAFVEDASWSALLADQRPDALIDACDQTSAKALLGAWALEHSVPCAMSGAAGGKREAQRVELADLSQVTHDPLLASVRAQLRRRHGAPRQGSMGLASVFSREPVAAPDASCVAAGEGDGSLNCHGYGSVVSVTASFGLCLAGWAINRLAAS